MITLILKEWKDFWSNGFSVISIAIILLLTYLFLWIFPDSNYESYGYAEVDLYFILMSYVTLFVVPIFAVGLLSKEYEYGTDELLRSLGITWNRALLSKFITSLLVICTILLLSGVHIWVLQDLELTPGTTSLSQLIGSYLGLLGVAGTYAAISLMITSFIKQTTASYVVSVFVCFMLFIGIDWISNLEWWSSEVQYQLEILSLSWHADQLARGILRVSSIIYVSAIIIWALWVASYRLSTREL